MEKQNWYFTFGVGDQLFSKNYVCINDTYGKAREKMFEVFKDKWAFQYDEKSFGNKYGCTEIKLEDAIKKIKNNKELSNEKVY